MFRYCIQIKILTSSIRIRNSVCTCLDGFKAGSELVRFPAWVQFFVSGVTCSARLLRLFSCGDLRWLRDVTGKSSPPHSLTSWLRYGFGTVLDPLRWLVSLRESPAGRLPGQPCARFSAPSSGAPKSCKRRREEKGAPLARHLFNCPVWTPPTGGWSNQIVRMGRSSTHVHGFLARHFQWRKE